MKRFLPVINLSLCILLIIAVSLIFVIYLHTPDHIIPIVGNTQDTIGFSYVLAKIDSNFSLTLTIVSILFALFNILTYASIKERFSHKIDILKKEYDKSRKKNEIHNKDVLSLKVNIEQVCDLEDSQNLSLIFSKLDFPNLD